LQTLTPRRPAAAGRSLQVLWVIPILIAALLWPIGPMMKRELS